MRVTDKNNTPHPGGPVPERDIFPSVGPSRAARPRDDQRQPTRAPHHTDALVPGIVKEGARAIWQLDQVRLYDGGADSDGDTAADNSLFADAGLFVP